MSKKEIVTAVFVHARIITENSDAARDLYNQSRYGALQDDGRVLLSKLEAAYLLDKGRIQLVDGKNKEITLESFIRKVKRTQKNFWIRFKVFKDLRDRGYIVKTALKFGADFRVYDRGIKPGEDHAKWIVYPTHESEQITWHGFSAKNRVAHSTKKRLLVGVVDDEGDVTYWEIRWIRP